MIDIRTGTIPNTQPQLSYLTAGSVPSPIARVAILHGYGDHAGRYSHFMRWFAERNIASYALDFRGHGLSAGKPCAVQKWDDYLTDLSAFLAIDQLATENNPTPLFILGHSHGGLITAVASIRGMLNHARGIVLSAPYFDLKLPIPKLKRCFAKIASVIYPTMALRSGMTPPMLTRDPAMIADSRADPFCRGIATPGWFFQTLKVQAETRKVTGEFKLPLLMLIAGQDTVANSQASVHSFERWGSSDKTIQHYPDHRHELLRELGRETIFQNILDWIEKRASPQTLK